MDKSKDSKSPIRVKIIDMEYNKENNLFKMHVERLEDNEKASFAIKGEDFLITSDFPIEMINDFCEQMRGKEKNLFIEFEEFLFNKKDKDGNISDEVTTSLHREIDKYPIKEILQEEDKNNDGNNIVEK